MLPEVKKNKTLLVKHKRMSLFKWHVFIFKLVSLHVCMHAIGSSRMTCQPDENVHFTL